MIEQDVPAYVDMYEGMPHDFTLIMPSSMPGKICFKKWATFMTQAVEQTYGQGDLSTKLVEVNGTERDVQLQELMQYTSLEEMREAMELRIEGWAEP
jgi:hypothetical protein